jgi:MSHA biogenesis protein MshP
MNGSKKTQKGFSILAAVFLLIILASLAAFLASVSMMQQLGSAMDLQGSRAYQAARTGIEWGAFQALTPGAPPACPVTTLTFVGTTLQDFTTTVTCTSNTANEVGVTITTYQLTATACTQAPCPNPAPGQNYVERQWVMAVGR